MLATIKILMKERDLFDKNNSRLWNVIWKYNQFNHTFFYKCQVRSGLNIKQVH